jgi:hypothetical protein
MSSVTAPSLSLISRPLPPAEADRPEQLTAALQLVPAGPVRLDGGSGRIGIGHLSFLGE